MIPGTGLHPRPPLAALLQPHFPRVAADAHTPLLFAPQTGESHQGLHDRAASFLRLLIAHLEKERPEAKTILLVSHAATVIALGRALMQDRQRDVRAGTCSLSCYTRKAGSSSSMSEGLGQWECKLNGDCSFLTGGEQVSPIADRVKGSRDEELMEDFHSVTGRSIRRRRCKRLGSWSCSRRLRALHRRPGQSYDRNCMRCELQWKGGSISELAYG